MHMRMTAQKFILADMYDWRIDMISDWIILYWNNFDEIIAIASMEIDAGAIIHIVEIALSINFEIIFVTSLEVIDNTQENIFNNILFILWQ